MTINRDRSQQWDIAANRWVDDFTNFAPTPLVVDVPGIGVIEGATGEHVFQAAKFTDPAEREHVLSAPTPAGAKKRGKDRKKLTFRSDWDASASIDAMRAVVRAKVEQYPAIADQLRRIPIDRQFGGTAHAPIIEVTAWNDTIWGTTAGGRGANQLGQLWMEARAEAI